MSTRLSVTTDQEHEGTMDGSVMSLTHESVEGAKENWRNLFPRLDTSSFDIFGQMRAIEHARETVNEGIFDSFGITRADFQILALLIQRRRPLTPSEISEECGVTGASTTKRLRRLEANKMVIREVNPDDGRGWLIAPAEHIVATFEPLIEAVSIQEHQFLECLSAPEREQLTALLGKLRATVEERRDAVTS